MSWIESAALSGAVVVMGALAALAESGRIGNTLDVPVDYSVGTRGADGSVSWTTHTLGPCQVDQWSWELAEGETGLPLGWPLWTDARKDEYGNIIYSSNQLPLNADGTAAVAFFRYGDQVWLDASGEAAGKLSACTGGAVAPAPSNDAAAGAQPEAAAQPESAPAAGLPPPPPPLADEVLIEDLTDLARKVQSGEIILLEVGGLPGVRGHVVPVSLEDFTALVMLEVIDERMEQYDATALFEVAGTRSKALLVELLTRIGQKQ